MPSNKISQAGAARGVSPAGRPFPGHPPGRPEQPPGETEHLPGCPEVGCPSPRAAPRQNLTPSRPTLAAPRRSRDRSRQNRESPGDPEHRPGRAEIAPGEDEQQVRNRHMPPRQAEIAPRATRGHLHPEDPRFSPSQAEASRDCSKVTRTCRCLRPARRSDRRNPRPARPPTSKHCAGLSDAHRVFVETYFHLLLQVGARRRAVAQDSTFCLSCRGSSGGRIRMSTLRKLLAAKSSAGFETDGSSRTRRSTTSASCCLRCAFNC